MARELNSGPDCALEMQEGEPKASLAIALRLFKIPNKNSGHLGAGLIVQFKSQQKKCKEGPLLRRVLSHPPAVKSSRAETFLTSNYRNKTALQLSLKDAVSSLSTGSLKQWYTLTICIYPPLLCNSSSIGCLGVHRDEISMIHHAHSVHHTMMRSVRFTMPIVCTTPWWGQYDSPCP